MEMEFWRHTCGISPLEFCEIFINSTWNRSIKFHSIPWNSTFHLKMPTSASRRTFIVGSEVRREGVGGGGLPGRGEGRGGRRWAQGSFPLRFRPSTHPKLYKIYKATKKMEAKDRNHTHERRRLLPTVNEMMAAHNYSGTNASRSTDNLRYRDNKARGVGPYYGDWCCRADQ